MHGFQNIKNTTLWITTCRKHKTNPQNKRFRLQFISIMKSLCLLNSHHKCKEVQTLLVADFKIKETNGTHFSNITTFQHYK